MGKAHAVGSGENAHPILHAIAELLVDASPTVIVFPAEPPPWRRARPITI